jgi:uncharacterized coiled-coil protein SlyX
MEDMMLEERIAELEADNAALVEQVRELPLLRDQITLLVGRVQELLGDLVGPSLASPMEAEIVSKCSSGIQQILLWFCPNSHKTIRRELENEREQRRAIRCSRREIEKLDSQRPATSA